MGDSSPGANEKNQLNRVLLESIADVLCRVLGKPACQNILFHLEHNKGLPLDEIASHIEAFHSALSEILGPTAFSLESLIIENLSAKIESESNPIMIPSFVNHLNSIGP
ncbi:MAG TPA: hypothetical protein VK503_02370 [Candidatus Bathyarchaeia archaeon]|nr:hypothetical protein [Candidatus Bathyarchaeia archaeon]